MISACCKSSVLDEKPYNTSRGTPGNKTKSTRIQFPNGLYIYESTEEDRHSIFVIDITTDIWNHLLLGYELLWVMLPPGGIL